MMKTMLELLSVGDGEQPLHRRLAKRYLAAGFIFKLQHFHRLNLQARKVNVKAPAAGGSLNKPLRNIGPAFHRDALDRKSVV